jgi:hypothetical protein
MYLLKTSGRCGIPYRNMGSTNLKYVYFNNI